MIPLFFWGGGVVGGLDAMCGQLSKFPKCVQLKFYWIRWGFFEVDTGRREQV